MQVAPIKNQNILPDRQVSLVLDRILLLIFFLAITISSLVILTSSPHLYNSHVDPWEGEKHEMRDETEMCRVLREDTPP